MGRAYVTRYPSEHVMNYTDGTMSTQMRVAQEDAGWAVLNGDRPVAINGEVHHEDRDSLVSEIVSRGLFVWSDGSINKEAEPRDDVSMVFSEDIPDAPSVPTPTPISENVDGGAPPTEDPPTDPGADPEDPDPNPTVPVKPKDVEDQLEAAAERRLPSKTQKVKRVKITADVEKVAEGIAEAKAAPKAPRKPRAKKPEGAPRFTEEQKAARAEYAKKYRAQMTEEQKEQARERARERQKKWRESHPDKAAEFAKRSSERRKERYNEDPAFRAEYRAKQRQYAGASTPEKSDAA